MKAGNRLLLTTLVLFTGAIYLDVATAAPKKTMDVGVVLRLNDKFNDTVWQMMTGIETAKALFEKKNPGTIINLKQYPHGDDLESVVAASRRIISDKVPAVIGGEMSEESFVLGDQLGPEKIVFITPTSSNPRVTESKPFAFRACFSDQRVAQKLAEFTVTKLKPRSLGVIHNLSSPYTDYLAKEFIASFNGLVSGRSQSIPLIEEKILRETPSFDTQIESFQKNGVTHVAMLTHQSDLLKFVLQAGNKGFFPVYIGSDGWGSNENVHRKLVEESPFAEKFRAYRNNYWKQDSSAPLAVEFRRSYQAIHRKQPTAWSAIAFDSAWILFTAMSKARDPRSGTAIQERLQAIKKLALVTADQFTFGTDNSPNKDLYIYRLDKGGIKYEATLR